MFLFSQLARRGFAIVLISRSQEKLDNVSKAISESRSAHFHLCFIQRFSFSLDLQTKLQWRDFRETSFI